MVERILGAGARVLIADGYQAASTNRIAREAKISPGSLYQYFADKDAVVDEITQRLIEQFATAIAPALREAATQPPSIATRTVLDGVLGALEEHAGLLRALIDHVPTRDLHEAFLTVHEHLATVVFHTLATRRDALRQPDIQRTTWLIVEITQHLLIRYVLDSPAITRDDFLNDTSQVIIDLAYSPTPPSRPGAGRPRRAIP